MEEHKLKERIKTKFDGLRDKMGSASVSANIFIANSDICVSEYVLDDLNKDIDMPSNVDFTKLAKIASQNGKADIADLLIGYEQSIVKKIPFLLQINEDFKALKIAVDSGDPSIIDKAFAGILEKSKGPGSYGTVFELANRIEDCIRHLRNYAKKKKDNLLI